MRLKLIACEILYRELCALVASATHQVDLEFMPKGLHDLGGRPMCDRLQEAVDAVDAGRYEAVLMGYALCGNGIAGLQARDIPLVVPRGHDCITLFLGSKERYLEYFTRNTGAYFKTTGWIERGRDLDQITGTPSSRRTGVGAAYEELVARYGEDNARYLYERLGGYTRNYSKLVYIEMGLEQDERFARQTEAEAGERGMQFECVKGDMSLLQRLVDGPWHDSEFLTVPPGARIVARYDENVIEAEMLPKEEETA